ncbi:MAG: hypothetical protein ACI97P_001614 [Arcticibacterium sp.]
MILRKKIKQLKVQRDKIREVNRETLEGLMKSGIVTKVSMFNQDLDLVKMMFDTVLDEEVDHLASERYYSNKPHDGQHRRWAYNLGSLKVGIPRFRYRCPVYLTIKTRRMDL